MKRDVVHTGKRNPTPKELENHPLDPQVLVCKTRQERSLAMSELRESGFTSFVIFEDDLGHYCIEAKADSLTARRKF